MVLADAYHCPARVRPQTWKVVVTRFPAEADHFVYLYRNSRDQVLYVGYGRASDRALSHVHGSHNDRLAACIASGDYRVEIAGPFGDAVIGRAVETALISALRPECNISQGHGAWRFRPLGIPQRYAERLDERTLRITDLLAAQGETPTPLLLVIVNSKTLADGRVGYDAVNPPSDAEVRQRVERWWQLKRRVPDWAADPSNSPGLLLGLHGSKQRRTIIASFQIDRGRWADAETTDHGRIRVPLLEPDDLDAFGLRGRRVSADEGISFGAIPSQFFWLADRQGRLFR